MEYYGIAPLVAAHRGWHMDGAPKNSVAALERAALEGTNQVELDVRRLLDGTLVVYHDAALPDGRKLADIELHQFRVSAPSSPTLDEFARRAAELDMPLLVELKESGYESQVVQTLRRHMPDSKVEYFSFKTAAVRALSRLVPDRPVGLLTDLQSPARSGAQLVQDARANGASFLGLNVRQTDPILLAQLGARDFPANVWTVDQPGDLTRLARHRAIRTLISDRPDLALEAQRDADRRLADAVLRRSGTTLDDVVTTVQRVASTIR